jgi:hypothetical protein
MKWNPHPLTENGSVAFVDGLPVESRANRKRPHLKNVIDCGENRCTGALDVDQYLEREIPGPIAARI